ncbi:MAG: zinc ribbon domain-containing protein [Sideroxydans sp.]|nr:zinc ribbon domain-containing protein [Sideroxydans sp.]
MPIYDYQCADCGKFEAMRRIENRDAPAVCPHCGMRAERVLVAAPNLPIMASNVRHAMATNERARHEPKSSSSSRHPRGCGCCKASARANASTPPAPKSFANKRPWMISH